MKNNKRKSAMHLFVLKKKIINKGLLNPICNELDERSACEIEMLPLFGFFTQQIVPFIQRAYTYIGKIDNGQRSSIAVTRSVEVKR